MLGLIGERVKSYDEPGDGRDGVSNAQIVSGYWFDALRDLKKAQESLRFLDRPDLDKKLAEVLKVVTDGEREAAKKAFGK
jgi:hypothetical protein